MTDRPRSLVIVTPVFNDWTAFDSLVGALERALADAGLTAHLLAVDDGSSEDAPEQLTHVLEAITGVEVLQLRRNLGHQRAIAIGLAFIRRRAPCDVIVMDSDGEDDPADVPRLLARLDQEKGRVVVFAERTRRAESTVFRIGYALYRVVHFALTGRTIRFGNFSAIPARRLDALVGVAEMWNHYAAAVVKSRQPYCTIPTNRARRLHGASSMRYVDLVVHGLSAISVYGDIVGVRLLVGVLVLIALVSFGAAAAVAVRFLTPLAIPGWATYVVGISLVLLVQALLLAAFLSVLILSGRQSISFLPLRDYMHFVLGTRRLYPRA